MTLLLGFLLVTIAGLATGSIACPIKVMRKFQFEQFWFIGMLVGLLIMPWGITLSSIPSAFAAYGAMDPRLLIKSNIFAFGWAMQILGNQGVGFVSGEWRGVLGVPRKQMYIAITILIVAVMIMAYGNMLIQNT